MARPKVVRLNVRGDLRGMHGKTNVGKKKCPFCGKLFSVEEIHDHIKVHQTEEHLNNLTQTPNSVESLVEQSALRMEAKYYSLREITYHLTDVIQQLLNLERRF